MKPVDPNSHTSACNDATEDMAYLKALRDEHTELNATIDRLSADPASDQLFLRRLKQRKLVLKDMIAKLESRLIPDLNA